MDLEQLQALIKSYENRSLDDFLAVWCEVSDAEHAARDIKPANAGIVRAYVTRLRSAELFESVLADLKADTNAHARDCIEIAMQVVPAARRPKSRNRALQVIRAHQAREHTPRHERGNWNAETARNAE